MERYAKTEIHKILSSLNKFYTTGKISLEDKDRKIFIKCINPKKFKIIESLSGLLSYEGWAIPYAINDPSYGRPRNPGEGLERGMKKVFDGVSDKLYVDGLVSIWKKNVPDVAIIFAAVIEISHQVGVLPTLNFNKDQPYIIRFEPEAIALNTKAGEKYKDQKKT